MAGLSRFCPKGRQYLECQPAVSVDVDLFRFKPYGFYRHERVGLGIVAFSTAWQTLGFYCRGPR